MDSLRELSGGKPIGIKMAAGNIEADLEYALFSEPDFITLDGRAGATGAAPKVVKDATSIPTIFALCRARKFLLEHDANNVSLIITGGLRISSDFAKALALGADARRLGDHRLDGRRLPTVSNLQYWALSGGCHRAGSPTAEATEDREIRETFGEFPSRIH